MKHTIANILRSLISNQAVIDSRKNKWWITVIIFVLTVFIPWMPSLISGYTSNTASLLTATANYEVDKGFKAMMESDYFQNITIKDESGTLTLAYDLDSFVSDTATFSNETSGENASTLFKASFEDNGTGGSEEKPFYQNSTTYCATTKKGVSNLKFDYYYDCISVSNEGQVDTSKLSTSTSTSSSATVYENTGRTTYLEAYFFPTLTRANNDLFLSNFVYSVVFGMSSSSSATRFPHSYSIWGKDFMVLAIFPLKSSLTSLSASASYEGSLSEGLKNMKATSGTKFYTFLAGSDTAITDIYTNGFASFMHEAGRPAYIKSVWLNIMVLAIATVACVVIAGVVLLIFSKRKTSAYRDTNFFQAISEGVYITFCPAIISALSFFLSSSYGMIILVGATLMRVVFIMNRICPPPEADTQNGSKPLYQARD